MCFSEVPAAHVSVPSFAATVISEVEPCSVPFKIPLLSHDTFFHAVWQKRRHSFFLLFHDYIFWGWVRQLFV